MSGQMYPKVPTQRLETRQLKWPPVPFGTSFPTGFVDKDVCPFCLASVIYMEKPCLCFQEGAAEKGA